MAAKTEGTKVTTDHDQIRRWTEERKGKPAVVKDTINKGDGVGVIRINFPDYSGRNTLKEITWDEFFQTFEEKKLAFLYQDKTRDGKESRFFKFISRK